MMAVKQNRVYWSQMGAFSNGILKDKINSVIHRQKYCMFK